MKLIANYPYYRQEITNKPLLFFPTYSFSSFSLWYPHPSYFSPYHLSPYQNHCHPISSSYACYRVHYCLTIRGLLMFGTKTNLCHSVSLQLEGIEGWILLDMISCWLIRLLLLQGLLILWNFLSSNQVCLGVMASNCLINS